MTAPVTAARDAAARLRSMAETECARWHEPAPADLDPADPAAGFALRYDDGSALAVAVVTTFADAKITVRAGAARTGELVDAVMAGAEGRRAGEDLRDGLLRIGLEDLRAVVWRVLASPCRNCGGENAVHQPWCGTAPGKLYEPCPSCGGHGVAPRPGCDTREFHAAPQRAPGGPPQPAGGDRT